MSPIQSIPITGADAGVSRKGRRRSQEEMESMKEEILELLADRGALPMRDIYTAFGYSTYTSGFRRCVYELMEDGRVEYVYPEAPRSCRQRLRLSVRR